MTSALAILPEKLVKKQFLIAAKKVWREIEREFSGVLPLFHNINIFLAGSKTSIFSVYFLCSRTSIFVFWVSPSRIP
jgi:hypothetical protein